MDVWYVALLHLATHRPCSILSRLQCEDDENVKSTAHCSEAGPPTVYKPGPIALILLFMVLESIGAHGFVGFFGGILLVLGFIKLSFGSIICCRKTKAQEHTEKMVEKGVPPKSERFTSPIA